MLAKGGLHASLGVPLNTEVHAGTAGQIDRFDDPIIGLGNAAHAPGVGHGLMMVRADTAGRRQQPVAVHERANRMLAITVAMGGGGLERIAQVLVDGPAMVQRHHLHAQADTQYRMWRVVQRLQQRQFELLASGMSEPGLGMDRLTERPGVRVIAPGQHEPRADAQVLPDRIALIRQNQRDTIGLFDRCDVVLLAVQAIGVGGTVA